MEGVLLFHVVCFCPTAADLCDNQMPSSTGRAQGAKCGL